MLFHHEQAFSMILLCVPPLSNIPYSPFHDFATCKNLVQSISCFHPCPKGSAQCKQTNDLIYGKIYKHHVEDAFIPMPLMYAHILTVEYI